MKIERGRVVSVHYTLRDEGGAMIESSDGREPLAYLHGYGQLIPGLEKALDGSSAGERKAVTVPPRDAYGDKDENAVIRASKDDFPTGLELAPGVEVQADTPDGPITFMVLAIEGNEAVLDANHPLAGKTLTFDVEVIDVREASAEEIAHGHVHGAGGAHGHD